MLEIKRSEEKYDVIIAGGGPAGCAAAVGAAREGAKTLLIESQGYLGGMATGGLVTCFAPFSDGEKIISTGFAEKMMHRIREECGKYKTGGWIMIRPENFKRILDEEVKGEGADVLFHTIVCGVEVKDDKICSVYAANKSGVTEYEADIIIDCTGDADVAAKAGVPFEYGDENGETQPGSLCFMIAGINMSKLDTSMLYGATDNSVMRKMIPLEKYPLINESHSVIDIIGDGIISFNTGHIWDIDVNDPKAVSEKMIYGRELAREYYDALVELLPEAFSEAVLIETAPLLGVRESRRIKGKYVFTVDDYFARRTFYDDIARNCYVIDIHGHRTDESLPQTEEEKKKEAPYNKGESHGIPFRCMLPINISNMIVAGRSISCDRISQGSLRVMPNCMTMGEAAGVAAGMCIRDSALPENVDIKALREKLNI